MENNSASYASHTASIPALCQYLKMANLTPIDTQSIIERAGLNAEVIGDNTRRIPLEQFEDILLQLIEGSQDPLFGFHTSEFIEPASYSVNGYISLNCATLKEVLATIPTYEKIVGDMGTSELEGEVNKTLLRWNSQLQNPTVKRHVRENIICSWFRFTHTFLNIEGSPEAVWFEHPAPKSAKDLDKYHQLFNCEVRFSQPYTGIWLSNDMLDAPISQGNEKLLHVLFDHASQLLNELDRGRPLTEQVKSMLRLTLNLSLIHI